MANTGTLDSELFILHDGFPGYPDPRLGEPTDGFTGATHHNVATAIYAPGTKIQVPTVSLTSGIVGQATLTYLRVGVQHSDNVIAAKSPCGQASATVWSVVSNGVSVVYGVAMTPIAIALSAMTDAYYGWFWTGGSCPEDYVAALAGNYITDDTVVYGQMVPAAGAATLHYLVFRVQTANELAGGFAYCLAATDTAT